MENIITTGMINKKKNGGGRQRVKHLDGLKMWLQKGNAVLIHSVAWETERSTEKMIANAMRQDIESWNVLVYVPSVNTCIWADWNYRFEK